MARVFNALAGANEVKYYCAVRDGRFADSSEILEPSVVNQSGVAYERGERHMNTPPRFAFRF